MLFISPIYRHLSLTLFYFSEEELTKFLKIFQQFEKCGVISSNEEKAILEEAKDGVTSATASVSTPAGSLLDSLNIEDDEEEAVESQVMVPTKF